MVADRRPSNGLRRCSAGSVMKVLKEHVLIVAPALPRWVSDFNVLSSTFAEAGWHVVVMHPRENGRSNSGWDSAETIDKARHALHPKVTSRPLPLSLNKGRISITDLIATSVKAAILVGQGSHLFILWSALPILLFGTW